MCSGLRYKPQEHAQENILNIKNYRIFDQKDLTVILLTLLNSIFEILLYKISWEEIVNNEIFRQRDKSNNNDIGYFHQNIFSYFEGCEVPQTGWDVIYRNPDGIVMPDGDIVHTLYVEMKINRYYEFSIFCC